jgi:hypothetical protein
LPVLPAAWIEVDRVDPANRPFAHNDIIGWTEAHRPELLADLYTVLLGNPFLRTPPGTEAETRFKDWPARRRFGRRARRSAARQTRGVRDLPTAGGQL